MIHAVFMGSPELAVPSLRALHAAPGVRVSGVVTQPDRPAGRRRVLRPCAVKAAALELGLPTVAPTRLKGEEALQQVRDFGAELIVVCAYGRILPRSLLDLPRLGCFNLHFSLLPRWRGASPVQAALLAGDATTGVSLQRMVEALDAGAYEAWFVDREGHVTEGSSTNAWIVVEGQEIVTRPLGHDILAGITRQSLIDVARANNMRVTERLFTVAEAKSAREAFLTSTTSFVMPIVSIDGTAVGEGRPGRVTLQLLDAYRRHLDEGVAP